MKNILHVVPCLENGGTERYLINLLKCTYKRYNNIVLYYGNNNYWTNELKKMNIEVLSTRKPAEAGIYNNYKDLCKIIKNNNIDIVYSYTFYNSAIVLLAAFKWKIKKRIVHSHTSETNHKKTFFYKIYTLLCKILISVLSTHKFACSDTAGRKLFFGKYQIINNCIDTDKYIFNNNIRKKYRKEYGISDNTIVIGSVGRLDINKNHQYIINIFSDFKKKNKNSKLIIVGDGPEKDNLINLTKKLKISDDVIFFGNINNVDEIYNMFDIFTLQSFNEGLPFVLIEAQTNGLKCIVSDNVDKRSAITSSVKFINLNDKYNWLKEMNNSNRYTDNYQIVKDSGFSLDKLSEFFNSIYN